MYTDPNSSTIIGLLTVNLVILLVMIFAVVVFVVMPVNRVVNQVNSVTQKIDDALRDVKGSTQQVQQLSNTVSTVVPEFKQAICQFIPTLPFCRS